MSSFYGGGGFDPSKIETIKTYICGVNQYNNITGLPTILEPDQNTFYLVPGDNGYNEYYYKNGNWELFGSADNKFDLSDRMTKGVNSQGNIVTGAVIEGNITGNDKNTASGQYSHAEGYHTNASGSSSHAEGNLATASGSSSHAEGNLATASGSYSHAEGTTTTASGSYGSHAEGRQTTASNNSSHAEGYFTTASGYYSHAEGHGTIANHASQHVFGEYNIADTSTANTNSRGNYVEIVGNGVGNTKSNARTLDWSGNQVLAGKLTVGVAPTNDMDVATKQYVDQNSSSFDLSDRMAKGVDNQGNVVSGAVIQGNITGNYKNTASSIYSHAEGYNTISSGGISHAEGYSTTASNSYSHAEGSDTTASGVASHAEGYYTIASAYASHAEGTGTTANHRSQHVFGEYNITDSSNNNTANKGNYVEIVGNGGDGSHRSNARTLDWSGNEKLAGSLTLGMGTANEITITAAQLSALLALSSAQGVTF